MQRQPVCLHLLRRRADCTQLILHLRGVLNELQCSCGERRVHLGELQPGLRLLRGTVFHCEFFRCQLLQFYKGLLQSAIVK